MQRGRSKDLVALVALLCAVSYGTWLWMRTSLQVGGGWTDGEQKWSSVRGERVRYAVWDRPEPLPGVEGEVASHPALSPDGRWLVFVVGERGLNADLYVAELASGVALDVRPLWSQNSPRDELTPTFAGDALYFATDRSGSGDLDIWRAAYSGGSFAPPEPLARGVNSAADESDPYPLADGSLLFSSNRPRAARVDFDLYLARSVPGADALAVEPLATLNTPFDERDPTLSADARTLVFASDQQGGAGGFDLYRSFLDDDGWLAPEPMHGLNEAASERGALLSRDGFELWFDRTEAGGAPELWHARSRELYHVPGPPVSWRELLLFSSLLILALLAWLAKRWTALEIIYKCFLVSLLVHLLLLWLLRDVHPGTGTIELPGEERGMRVRLEPREESVPRAARERAGELQALQTEAAEAAELERLAGEMAAQELVAAAPSVSGSLAVPEAPAPSAPARDASALEAPRLERPRTSLETREAPTQRLSASAPGLAVAARPAPARPPETAQIAPSSRRALSAPAPDASARPSTASALDELAAPAEAAPDAARLAPDDVARADAPALEVAQPRETTARAGPAAPALALPRASTQAPARTDGASAPGATPSQLDDTPLAWSPSGAPEQQAEPLALLAPEPGPGPSRRAVGFEASPADTPELDVRAIDDPAASERFSGAAPGLAVAARAAAERPTGAAEQAPDARRAVAAPQAEAVAQPDAFALEDLAAPAELDAAPGASRLAPTDVARADLPSLEVAQPEDESAAAALAAAPELALPSARMQSPAAGAATGEPGQALERHDGQALAWSPPSARAESEEPLAFLAPDSDDLGAPRRREVGFEGARPSDTPELEVRRVVDPGASERKAGSAPEDAPRRFDALAGLERGSAGLPRAQPSTGAGPARLGVTPDQTPQPIPPPSAPLALTLPPVPEPSRPDDRPSRSEENPYKNRFGDEKLRALEEFGGGQETERAVAAGLAYLASIQNERGFWGSRRDYHDKYGDVRIGKTALAMLAFLGAGHTPRSGAEHAEVSERAVDFLLSQLDPSSGHFGDSCSYGHGIATYALAECYALTKDPVLDRPLRAAIQHILENQNGREDPRFYGGWGYYYNDGRVWENDRWPRVSVTSWQVMALESARLGGIEVPETAFEGARRFLLEAWDERREAFRYNHDPARLRSGYPILPASTPAALFALSLLGEDAGDASFAAARRFVLARQPQEYRFTSEDDFVFEARGNLYFWYYATLAMFRSGGGSWRRWNTSMKETLLPAQEPDGSWRRISIYAEYAGDDDADRSYSTAMCVLTLEVYYRYFTPLLADR